MQLDELDPLWTQFVPLWNDLRAVAPALLLAGGYGLILKQIWIVSQTRHIRTEDDRFLTTEAGAQLITEESVQTLINIDRWKNLTPRATRDFDFIASLDLIASADEQPKIRAVLDKHGYVTKTANWQFQKTIDPNRSVDVDFHAPPPIETRSDIRIEGNRIKPLKALGKAVIHGYPNPETVGAALHPFSFAFNDVDIRLPNTVTIALMKIMAMHEKHLKSLESKSSEKARGECDAQAHKHAEDLYRAMAMMTRPETEHAGAILEEVRRAPVFQKAKSAFSEHFGTTEGWGAQVVAPIWQEEDSTTIQVTLAEWFR